jgi:hypothetical protein
MHEQGTLPDVPSVAPWESCIRCFKGDTGTGFWVEGEAEWCMAGLMVFADLPERDATAVIEHYAQTELGCAPGMVPAGRIKVGV